MNSDRTERKVIQGGLWGAVTIIIVWIASLVGLDVPTTVAQAFTVVLSSGAAWYTK